VRHLDDFGRASQRLVAQAVEAVEAVEVCGYVHTMFTPTAALAHEYAALLRRERAAAAAAAAAETWTGSRVVDSIMLDGLAGGFKTLMDETDGLGSDETEEEVSSTVSSLARRAAAATDEADAARRKLLAVALPLRTLVQLHREIPISPQDEARAEMGAERTHPARLAGAEMGAPPHGSTTVAELGASAPPPTSFTPTPFTPTPFTPTSFTPAGLASLAAPPRVSAADSATDSATVPATASAPVLLRGASRRWLAPGAKSAKALNLELLHSLNTTLRLDDETMLNTTLAELRHVGERLLPNMGERLDASLFGKRPSEALGSAASSTAAPDCRAGPSASPGGGGGGGGSGGGGSGGAGGGAEADAGSADGQGDGAHSGEAAASPSLLTLLFRQGVCMRLSVPNFAACLLHRRLVPAPTQPPFTATVHTSSSAAAPWGRPPQRGFEEWTELARAGVGGLTIALSTAGIEAVPNLVPNLDVLGEAARAPTGSPPRPPPSTATRRTASAVSGAVPAAEQVREASLGLVWKRRTSWSVRLCSLAVFDGTVQLPSLGGGARSATSHSHLAGGDVALQGSVNGSVNGSVPRRAAQGVCTEASSSSAAALDALLPRAVSSIPQLGAEESAVESLARPESMHISQREILDETRAGGLARNAAAVGKLLRSLFTGGKGHGPVKSSHADERSRRSPAGEVGDRIELEAEAEAARHFGEAYVPSGDLSSQVLLMASNDL
jgi:hypothetical protein